jgi:hypothetical protein
MNRLKKPFMLKKPKQETLEKIPHNLDIDSSFNDDWQHVRQLSSPSTGMRSKNNG